MMEEAEKNAFVDQSKKSLIILMYGSDTVLSRMEHVLNSELFRYCDPDPEGYLFRGAADKIESIVSRKDLKSLAKLIQGKFIPLSVQGLMHMIVKFKFIALRRKRTQKPLIIDVDFIDEE